ncbi:MAG: DUF4249 domain-containing protein [Ginsengibacter sp.]
MGKSIHQFIKYAVIILIAVTCKKSYQPPAITAINNFLVVDGNINTAPASATTITLSRARRLIDTVTSIPELHAQVFIENNSGIKYLLQEMGGGKYTSDQLTLNGSDTYRLDITTANGRNYQSEFVPVIQTPAIDSLNWKREKDVTVYVNTHDPQNDTRYYRWEYEETWEYHSFYETILGTSNGRIFYRDSITQAFKCWSNSASTDIILGSSVKLSEDVISNIPIAVVPENSPKINFRYGILAKQYGLTKEAYAYWQILQKSTQQLGTLFDAQPSQLAGNIHSIENPTEPVIGYISASSIQQKRMFINNKQLDNWHGVASGSICDISFIPQDPNPSNYLIFHYSDTTYGAYYFVTGGIAITKKTCLDCTLAGGSNTKPNFW